MRTPSSSSANVYFLVFNAESHRYFDGFVGQGVCPSQTDETETSASCLEVAGIWHRATTSLRIKRHFKHQLLKSDRRKQEKSQTLMQ